MSHYSRPHPYVAGILGLIPGVGHLYLGRYRTAGYKLIRFALTILPLVFFHFDPITTLPWAFIPYIMTPLAKILAFSWIFISALKAYRLALAMAYSGTAQQTTTPSDGDTDTDVPTDALSPLELSQRSHLKDRVTSPNCGRYLDPDPGVEFCPWCGRKSPSPDSGDSDSAPEPTA